MLTFVLIESVSFWQEVNYLREVLGNYYGLCLFCHDLSIETEVAKRAGYNIIRFVILPLHWYMHGRSASDHGRHVYTEKSKVRLSVIQIKLLDKIEKEELPRCEK